MVLGDDAHKVGVLSTVLLDSTRFRLANKRCGSASRRRLRCDAPHAVGSTEWGEDFKGDHRPFNHYMNLLMSVTEKK